jgi:hypothetical protein
VNQGRSNFRRDFDMRKHALQLASLLSIALAVALFAPQRAAADDDDPPSRVARLSYINGNVSFNPAGTDDWVNAVVNRPITTGDKLWSDNGARAELHIGSAAIRLASNTGFSFLNLDDRTAQIRITEGTLSVRVRSLDQDETFEIDTPNLAFSVLRPGNYRINVNEAGDTTIVTVRDGEGEVTGGGSAYTVHPRETGTFAGTDQLDADIQSFGDNDDFDRWCSDRDRHADRSTSARYVSSDVIGYDDLDDNGGWRSDPEYGNVWFPHTTVVGWAPYRYGHWVWISPWGWTWVDDEPWGFAPFHYGRWVVVRGVWGWVPSPPRAVGVVYVRPVYAPALVAWVGGPHFSVGVAVGGGGGVGVAWFPLGPRDVYCPSYHVSERYVQNVNISNTRIVNQTNITNVYNTVYVNKTVNVTNVTYQNQTAPNAVTATSHQAFTSAMPVARNPVKFDAREVASAPVAPMTPSVAPQQHSVLGAGTSVSVKPPAASFSRAVVAKTAPPPPPPTFARQQQVIQANGGRPPAVSQIRQVQAENAQQTRANIKIAPPAQPGTPRNAQTNRPVGNVQGNQGNVQNNPPNVQNNNNRPPSASNNSASPNPPNRPTNNPPANAGNAPANTGNPRVSNDRPPSARQNNPNNSNAVNPQLDQKHQQQLEQLRQKQDQERQKVEQQQIQEQQKIQQKNAEDARKQQANPKQQQQVQQEQQRIQQKNAEDARRPQVDQKQQPQQIQEQQKIQQKNAEDARKQQVDQKQEQQLKQLEQKHGQQQQQLQQRQDQERQKAKPAEKPPKAADKPPKKEKDDKPPRTK